MLDPWLWPEGSYELGSVLPSRSFLAVDSLAFPETQHGVTGPCVVVHESWICKKENLLSQKWGKWAENGPKTGFFGFIEKFSHFF